MDELVAYLPQVGAYGALAFAAVYAVRRTIKSDGEMREVISAKDSLIAQLLAEIARKDAEIERLRK